MKGLFGIGMIIVGALLFAFGVFSWQNWALGVFGALLFVGGIVVIKG